LLDLLEGGLYAQSGKPIAANSPAVHQPQEPTPDWLTHTRNPSGNEHLKVEQEAVSVTSRWAPQRIRRAAG
jgi:hypothetical protein